MDCVDEQDADLFPLFLNEANRRRGHDASAIERRLHCCPTTGLRGEIEPYDMFVTLEGLYIGHREVARPLSGTPLPDNQFRDSNPGRPLCCGLEVCPLR